MLRDTFYLKSSKKKKIGLICLLALLLSVGVEFVMEHNLGSRLQTQMNKNDDSSMARFILINILGQFSLTELLFGSDRALFFQKKYSLIAIENSIVNTIFYYGIIYAILF